MDVRAAIRESELKNPHAGKIKLLAQGVYRGGNHSQVFRDKREAAQLVAQTLKELCSRRLDPLAVYRGCVLGGNRPEGLKSAEVVEANNVVKRLGAAYAIDPPRETLLLQNIPLIQRIAPSLSRCREVVRGHARDTNRRKVFAQLEDSGIGPDIRAVVVHKDRDIADEFDTQLAAVRAQIPPLLAEGKLDDLFDRQLL